MCVVLYIYHITRMVICHIRSRKNLIIPYKEVLISKLYTHLAYAYH